MLTGEVFSEKNDKFGGNIRMFDGFLRVAAATPDIRHLCQRPMSRA